MLDRLNRKGFDSGQIDSTVRFLEETGLINDNALAADLLKYSMQYKPLGKKGIRMFLIKRGIDKELIDFTISTHTSDMEEKSAHELIQRKLRTLKNHPENVIKRRLWGMLQRRGFSGKVIYKAINSIEF
jgi:regulatory protein